jgi:hypothetical protein
MPDDGCLAEAMEEEDGRALARQEIAKANAIGTSPELTAWHKQLFSGRVDGLA